MYRLPDIFSNVPVCKKINEPPKKNKLKEKPKKIARKNLRKKNKIRQFSNIHSYLLRVTQSTEIDKVNSTIRQNQFKHLHIPSDVNYFVGH